jgi:hypothetical protein
LARDGVILLRDDKGTRLSSGSPGYGVTADCVTVKDVGAPLPIVF